MSEDDHWRLDTITVVFVVAITIVERHCELSNEGKERSTRMDRILYRTVVGMKKEPAKDCVKNLWLETGKSRDR